MSQKIKKIRIISWRREELEDQNNGTETTKSNARARRGNRVLLLLRLRNDSRYAETTANAAGHDGGGSRLMAKKGKGKQGGGGCGK